MKVLWITNDLFPEAKSLLTNSTELRATGGWMLGLADSLKQVAPNDFDLYVASVSTMVADLTKLKGKDITYFAIPYGKGNIKYNKEYESYWRQIYDTVKPDIVHIHGTESSHGLAFLNVCPETKTVISIQGLASVCHRFFNHGISKAQLISSTSLYTMLRRLTLFHLKKIFKIKGDNELEIIKQAKYFIGRTEWDKAHTWAINPDAEYKFCNEILRNEFYTGCWNYEACNKHTIFMSQAWYPIKGLHMLLKAMPLILREYPDTVIKIGGKDITAASSLKERMTMSSYGRIIKRLIKKYNLEKHVKFLNPLNATEMKEEYLKCNLFLCPSTLENSSNSLGEAQILGVPCVASYVGGVADMIPNAECGKMYRFEEIEMLAKCIVDTFKESKNFDNTTMREIATKRHDRIANAIAQYNIYKEIINEC